MAFFCLSPRVTRFLCLSVCLPAVSVVAEVGRTLAGSWGPNTQPFRFSQMFYEASLQFSKDENTLQYFRNDTIYERC